MRRTLLTLTWWLVLAPIAVQSDVSAAPSEKLRPNIVIILQCDRMGAGNSIRRCCSRRCPTYLPLALNLQVAICWRLL